MEVLLPHSCIPKIFAVVLSIKRNLHGLWSMVIPKVHGNQYLSIKSQYGHRFIMNMQPIIKLEDVQEWYTPEVSSLSY